MFDGMVNKVVGVNQDLNFDLEKSFYGCEEPHIILCQIVTNLCDLSLSQQKKEFPLSSEDFFYVNKNGICVNYGFGGVEKLLEIKYKRVLMHLDGFRIIDLDNLGEIMRVVWTRSYDVFSVYKSPVFSVYDGEFYVLTVTNDKLDVYALDDSSDHQVNQISSIMHRMHKDVRQHDMLNYSLLVSHNSEDDCMTIHAVSYPDDESLVVKPYKGRTYEKRYLRSIQFKFDEPDSLHNTQCYALNRKMPLHSRFYADMFVNLKPHHHNMLISVDSTEYRYSDGFISYEIEGQPDISVVLDESWRNNVGKAIREFCSASFLGAEKAMNHFHLQYTDLNGYFEKFWVLPPKQRKEFVVQVKIDFCPVAVTEDNKILTTESSDLSLRDYVRVVPNHTIHPIGTNPVVRNTNLRRGISTDTKQIAIDNSPPELLVFLKEMLNEEKNREAKHKTFEGADCDEELSSRQICVLLEKNKRNFPYCLRDDNNIVGMYPSYLTSRKQLGGNFDFLKISGFNRLIYEYFDHLSYHDLVNPTRIAIAENKTLTLMLAKLNGVRVPETLFFDDLTSLKKGIKSIEEQFGYPFYLKCSIGGAGTGVTRIRGRIEFAHQIYLLDSVGQKASYLVQKEVKGADKHCIRVIGLYGQIYCAYSRSGGKDGKASIAAGGEAKQIKLTDKQKKLVHKLFSIFRCDIVGFDFFVQDGEWLFNEVNPYYAGFNGPISFGMDIEKDFLKATAEMFEKKRKGLPLYTGEYKDIPQDIVIKHMNLIGASTQVYRMSVLEENGIQVRNRFSGNKKILPSAAFSGLFVGVNNRIIECKHNENTTGIFINICEYGYYNVSPDFALAEIHDDDINIHHVGKGNPNAMSELPDFLNKVKSLISFKSLVLAYDTAIDSDQYRWCVVTVDGMIRNAPQIIEK